jgi:DNA (cytosine-5)-methyltransferase 1
MDDERNQLFWDYVRVTEQLQPDGFIFENVTGLLNMQGGRVFELVRHAFSDVMPSIDGWLLAADEHAIPQRRKRVFLVGTRQPRGTVLQPPRITSCSSNGEFFSENQPAISVLEALADLPQLVAGQDGSALSYQGPPKTMYQSLMRGVISPAQYLDSIRFGVCLNRDDVQDP